MPTTTALSPASVTSIRIDLRQGQQAQPHTSFRPSPAPACRHARRPYRRVPTPPDRRENVPRYTRPAMAAIWSPENRYRIWFDIEALACEGMAHIGAIPAEAARTIRARGAPALAAIGPADVDRIDESSAKPATT